MINKDEMNMENINQLSGNPPLLFSNPLAVSEDISEEQAQFDLIRKGSEAQPVYIGAINFRGKEDRKFEIKNKYGVIDDDLANNIQNPEYSILFPDKYLSNYLNKKCEWTPQINQKFMEGAILSGRPIILVTNPNFYYNDQSNENGKKTWMTGPLMKNGTLYELLALKMNNYLFKKLDKNKTIAWRSQKIEDVDLSGLFNIYALVNAGKMECNKAYEKYADNIKGLKLMFDNGFEEDENCIVKTKFQKFSK